MSTKEILLNNFLRVFKEKIITTCYKPIERFNNIDINAIGGLIENLFHAEVQCILNNCIEYELKSGSASLENNFF